MRILIIITILFTSIYAYADTSSRPSALALEWWLKGQGKFEDARVRTIYDDKKNEYKITKWKVQGVAKPKKSELDTIIDNYEIQYVKPKTINERLVELENRVSALEP